MASIARLFGLALVALAALLRVWYRAVLAAPEVKRRKAAARLAASAGGNATAARPEDRPPTAGRAARRA